MTIDLHRSATVLFQGDSITDVGRLMEEDAPLGHGYVRMAADRVRSARPDGDLTFVNRGVSGDGVSDLRARWRTDAMDLKPDVVSVLIGVNDTWRRYDSGVVTSAGAYEDDYRAILTQVREELDAQLILIEPFLVPVWDEQWAWREDLDPRIQVVHAAVRGVRCHTAGGGRPAQPGGAGRPAVPSTSRATESIRPRSGTRSWRRHGRHWPGCRAWRPNEGRRAPAGLRAVP